MLMRSEQTIPELPAYNEAECSESNSEHRRQTDGLHMWSVYLSVCMSAPPLSAFQIFSVYSCKHCLYYHPTINVTTISGNQLPYKAKILEQAKTVAGLH